MAAVVGGQERCVALGVGVEDVVKVGGQRVDQDLNLLKVLEHVPEVGVGGARRGGRVRLRGAGVGAQPEVGALNGVAVLGGEAPHLIIIIDEYAQGFEWVAHANKNGCCVLC